MNIIKATIPVVSKTPIEYIPRCEEKHSAPKEARVVRLLRKTAFGVLELINSSALFV